LKAQHIGRVYEVNLAFNSDIGDRRRDVRHDTLAEANAISQPLVSYKSLYNSSGTSSCDR